MISLETTDEDLSYHLDLTYNFLCNLKSRFDNNLKMTKP